MVLQLEYVIGDRLYCYIELFRVILSLGKDIVLYQYCINIKSGYLYQLIL